MAKISKIVKNNERKEKVAALVPNAVRQLKKIINNPKSTAEEVDAAVSSCRKCRATPARSASATAVRSRAVRVAF